MLVHAAREKWESYGQSLYRLGFIKAFRFDPFLEQPLFRATLTRGHGTFCGKEPLSRDRFKNTPTYLEFGVLFARLFCISVFHCIYVVNIPSFLYNRIEI